MEKQIEKMRDIMLEKSNSANVEPVFTTSEGQEIVLGKDLTKLLNDVLEQAFIPFLAEALYSAGCRFPSDGEWIERPDLKGFVCSNSCGELFTEVEDRDMLPKHCPNCGTKMKNGKTIREYGDILCKRLCGMKGGE